MLLAPEDLPVGRTVYLFPQTKQASRNVHLMRTVSIMKDASAHWPRLVVGWKEGSEDRWELVHKDNIRLRPPAARNKADEKEGDTIQGDTGRTSGKWARVRRMPGKPKPVDTDETWVEETLF